MLKYFLLENPDAVLPPLSSAANVIVSAKVIAESAEAARLIYPRPSRASTYAWNETFRAWGEQDPREEGVTWFHGWLNSDWVRPDQVIVFPLEEAVPLGRRRNTVETYSTVKKGVCFP